jgi:hypothetical protein
MQYTCQGKVIGHYVEDDDSITSTIRLAYKKVLYVDVGIPVKLPLASKVFITFSDSEPEGGSA